MIIGIASFLSFIIIILTIFNGINYLTNIYLKEINQYFLKTHIYSFLIMDDHLSSFFLLLIF